MKLSNQVLALLAVAVIPLHSAYRYPGEPAGHAYQRYLTRLKSHTDGQAQPSQQGKTAVDSAKPISELNVSAIPVWDKQNAGHAFEFTRDLRFMSSESNRNFPRRSTWLYPDDGCFARAALVAQNLEQRGQVRPAKLFVFGDLTVKTPNAPGGSVSWWYHVVPVIRIAQQVWVFDPAIEPHHPISAKDWFLSMSSNPASLKAAVCDSYSYVPDSPCIWDHASPLPDATALIEQEGFLDAEWQRVIELKGNPLKLLGDSPPWKTLSGPRTNRDYGNRSVGDGFPSRASEESLFDSFFSVSASDDEMNSGTNDFVLDRVSGGVGSVIEN